MADQTSAVEQALKEFAEIGEKELANRPFATAGVAFLLGFLAGRASKG